MNNRRQRPGKHPQPGFLPWSKKMRGWSGRRLGEGIPGLLFAAALAGGVRDEADDGDDGEGDYEIRKMGTVK